MAYSSNVYSAGEFCKEVPEGIWCGWDKKHVTLTEDDFRPMDGLLPGNSGDGGDVIDYSVPKHEPRYTVKHPPVPEVTLYTVSMWSY